MPVEGDSPVIVTGGAGFVGLHIAEWLARNGRQVISLNRSPPDGVALNVAERFGNLIQFQTCDVCDTVALSAIVADNSGADLVHAAAITSGNTRKTLAMVDLHVRVTQVLVDLARDGYLRRLVVLSSAGVLQSPRELETLPEEYPPTLESAYSITKYASERLVHLGRVTESIDAVALRLPAIYGPYERPTRSRGRMSSIFEAVHLSLTGQQVIANAPEAQRDWTHADDIAQGIGLVLESDHLAHSLYHLGIGQSFTNRETMEVLAAHIPYLDLIWVDDPDSASVSLSSKRGRAALGIDRIRAELGFTPHFDLSAGVQSYLSSPTLAELLQTQWRSN